MCFLFVDRILQSSPGQSVTGIKHVTQNDVYLTTDDQGKVCFIPSLIGETLGQLAAWNVMAYHDFTLRPVAGVVGKARLHRPAFLGETIRLESSIDYLDEQVVHYHSEAYVNEDVVFSVEGALGPLLPMTDFIAIDEIKSQFAAIYHPGEQAPHTLFNAEPSSRVAPMVFDSILECVPGQSLIAQLHVNAAAPYFGDHFPKKPVLPMTVLLECQLNLAREFIKLSAFPAKYSVCELRKIKMNEFVQPGAVLLCYVKVKHHTEDELILTFRSEVDGKRVCVVDVVLLPQKVLI